MLIWVNRGIVEMETIILAVLMAFVFALGSGRVIIPILKRLKAGQQIREDGPKTHLAKAGTPTMGGIMILLSVIVVAVIFVKKGSVYLWLALIGATAYGLIGLLDDLIIVLKHRSLGLRPWQKIFMQLLFAILISVYAYRDPNIGSVLYVPIVGIYIDLGIWYIPFCIFFLLSVTNCVNLADGLDGLAGGVTIINSATFALIFIAVFPTAIWSGDMALFSSALTGGVLGFLRYNMYPAQVIMGDLGAFFLGGALAMVAVISRMELLIPVMGLMFVLSGLSCILQVGSYKLRKKRIFKMAPLHHHFELSGVPETRIVSAYMIVTVVTCLLTMLLIK